ncbi:MAG: ATP-binding protein [Patescibacteria group bacterium]|mgnify:CR=1 FL=1
MLFVGITLTGWVAIIMALSLSILSGIMFMLGTKKLHYLWGAFTATGAVWGIGFYMVSVAGDYESAQFWWRFALIGVICAPFTFFHFVTEFIHLQLSRSTRILVFGLFYSVCAVFVTLALTTNLLVNELTFLFGEVYYDTPPAALHPFFTLLYVSIISFSYLLIFKSLYFGSLPAAERRQAWYLIAGSGIGLMGGSMDLLLIYDVLYVHPIRNLLVIVGTAIVGFSILKYRLFDVKVVTAQFLTFFIVAFSIIRLATSASSQEIIFNTLMLGVTVAVGVYLIRSVRREVEQRDEIQGLYVQLEEKNKKLVELDKLKSQFLSIATHELRTPLTIVRNFIALMQDGSYGKVPEAMAEAGRQVFDRVTDMAKSVDTYLNVSRIEQGKITYDFADANLSTLVVEGVAGMQEGAKKRDLALTLKVVQGSEKLMAKLDAPKINEVINNLIDNSLKYTPKGSVTLTLEKVGKIARLTIVDTGVGMTQKTMDGLFQLFSPGEDSKKLNPASTGVGLYITKAHVEAHKGTLTAHSDGKGKGSKFVLDMPLAL